MLLDTLYLVIALVVVIGGPYTAYLFVIAFLSRMRIKAGFVSETINTRVQLTQVRLEIEITNLGDKPTALTPSVKVSALDALSRTPINLELSIESERRLEPQSPTIIVASTVADEAFRFSWYRRYTISVSRGTRAIIRHLNAYKTPIGFFNYWYGYLRFRLSDDWVSDDTGTDPG